jgi:hypothetical protein
MHIFPETGMCFTQVIPTDCGFVFTLAAGPGTLGRPHWSQKRLPIPSSFAGIPPPLLHTTHCGHLSEAHTHLPRFLRRAHAQIELPSDYTVNASVIAGGGTEPAIAQVYVNDVSGGSVNLTNLNVNRVGFGSNASIFIGVLYNQSWHGSTFQLRINSCTGQLRDTPTRLEMRTNQPKQLARLAFEASPP